MDQILTSLRQNGLRITPIKHKLLTLLTDAPAPLSVRDILSSLSANKTTIYREIKSLLKLGILFELDFSDGLKRYELSSHHHHHLICLGCKSITEVDLHDDFSSSEKIIEKEKGFTITKHQLEFYGFCHNCN